MHWDRHNKAPGNNEEQKNKEIPAGLNGMIGASKQDYVRRIHNCAERGQLYSMIDRENIRVNATK